ncbi:MAG: hypothetical protein E4H26_02995, partial [Flavobacteriales bacterium]
MKPIKKEPITPNINMNPLLKPFDEAPFAQIKNDHFKPAFEQAIENARAEIEAITTNSDGPTFENTI